MNTGKKTEEKKDEIGLGEEKRLHLLTQFMDESKAQIVKGITVDNTLATVLPDCQECYPILGEMIRNGQLVSFPTETVYGLGADATNEAALLQIYRVKRRPLSDPIIVHVLDLQQALELVCVKSQEEMSLFEELTKQFWPGPLTIILKANLSVLPAVVTAQTGFVGIRSPKNVSARRLIKESKRPIGAPSANLFSHVSPTSPSHVFNDFYDQKLAIINGANCEYGVQSTVVKIVGGNLQILREGSFSTQKFRQFVGRKFQGKVQINLKKKMQQKDNHENMEAPGQLLKHYAPYLPCYFTEPSDIRKSQRNEVNDNEFSKQVIPFSESAIISFSEELKEVKTKFKYYLDADDVRENKEQLLEVQIEDKFCTIEEKKKMRCLYHLLRKAENLDVRMILVGWGEEKQGTLWDKIFRATQGNRAQIY